MRRRRRAKTRRNRRRRMWLRLLAAALIVCAVGYLLFACTQRSGSRVNERVKAYEPLIQQYAAEAGISEYTALIEAVMMQESAGKGTDPMQASECEYNVDYPAVPNGITDASYSIQVGIQNLAHCLTAAQAKGPQDMARIKLALQAYNFGTGYLTWVQENGGAYSADNAAEFSKLQAEKLGWSSYGDPQYVTHVLRYYDSGDTNA